MEAYFIDCPGMERVAYREYPVGHDGFRGLGMLTAAEDFDAVESLCRRVKPKTVIEVGVWTGATTLLLSRFAERVYCVDHWHGSPGDLTLKYLDDCGGPEIAFRTFCRNMGDRLMKSVIPLIGESAMMASVWPSSFKVDMVYIDAGHLYHEVREDLRQWSVHVRRGGVIAGHDYSDAFPGVVRAVDEFADKKIVLGSVWSIEI